MVQQFNPLTAPLTMIKQVGEQAATAIQSVGSGLTTMASQGLDTLITGVPGLPGLPGAAATPGIPTPQQLMPANLQQALGQVENLLIPPGLPRPSQAFRAVSPPQPTPTPAAAPAQPPPAAVAQRRRVAERRGM
ncbi:hypothetical protein LCGC14_1312760 [marine sediment metagenome]|uniref:Uncharacterized protein n=1 Tax=marine sediment metagenome TaxID=412755 RepID=A0A0F9KLQ9_9ZZZZ